MTDAAVRMCVTRESSREEEVRESRREVLLASAGHREIVRAHTSARDGCLFASYEMDASACMCASQVWLLSWRPYPFRK